MITTLVYRFVHDWGNQEFHLSPYNYSVEVYVHDPRRSNWPILGDISVKREGIYISVVANPEVYELQFDKITGVVDWQTFFARFCPRLVPRTRNSVCRGIEDLGVVKPGEEL